MNVTVDHRPTPNKKLIRFLLLMMAPLPGIGVDLYVPSLPYLVHALHTTPSLIKLTIGLYLFGYAVGPILFGTLSDSYGRKKILYCGLIAYIASCLLIIAIPNIHVMLVLRFVQGFSIGALGAVYKAIASDVIEPGIEMRRFGAATSTTWAVGPMIAPFIGAYLLHYINWQACFVFLLGYAALVGLLFLAVPETNRQPVALNVGTVVKNYRIILRHKLFLAAVLCMGTTYSLITIFNVVGPFFIQKILGFSVLQFGHVALLMGAAFFLGGIFNRILVNKFSATSLVKANLILTMLFSVIMLILGIAFKSSIYYFTIPIFLVLFFAAGVFPAGLTMAMSLFPKMAGSASALTGFLFTLMTAIVASAASFLNSAHQTLMGIAYFALSALCLTIYILLTKTK